MIDPTRGVIVIVDCSREECRSPQHDRNKLCQEIGLGGRRAINLSVTGPGTIDLYRVCQIADVLDVSLARNSIKGRFNAHRDS
jgi:hypothetical protein